LVNEGVGFLSLACICVFMGRGRDGESVKVFFPPYKDLGIPTIREEIKKFQ
jgi:hypothetical protein